MDLKTFLSRSSKTKAAAIARFIGVTPAFISQWKKGVRPIPDGRCPAIELATSGQVTCEELRPDIRWVRLPDPEWPHKDGRPLVDHAKEAA
ncbi:transcriptional regulator [Azonexus sp. IMCC34839]|uniref:transcriptional regulator n=1 Tax=Azonexus sp. IMCC34839 TaxID=3133695 RepID=UPI00399B9769